VVKNSTNGARVCALCGETYIGRQQAAHLKSPEHQAFIKAKAKEVNRANTDR